MKPLKPWVQRVLPFISTEITNSYLELKKKKLDFLCPFLVSFPYSRYDKPNDQGYQGFRRYRLKSLRKEIG